MGMKISTKLANDMLANGGLKASLTGMELRIYGGAEPATADAAIGAATLLVAITEDSLGAPLEFETNAVDGVLQKSSAQVWEDAAVATGIATFCRLVLPVDADGASTTAPRLQGDAGLAGRFLNLTSTGITIGAVQRIGNLSVAMPLQ